MLRPSIFANNNLFDDFWNDSFWPIETTTASGNAMSTDIRETENGYLIDMELPGFRKEDVQAALKNGYLTITAEHTENKEEKDAKQRYIRRERYSGSYQRSFYVGKLVTEEDIKAKFTDGVLTVEVPKKKPEPQVEEKRVISIE